MTDDMPINLIDANQAREAIRQSPHLEPILQAMLKDDVPVLLINQGIEPFNIPSAGRPWIVLIQDDPAPGNLSRGPEGFDRKSLETAIQAATLAVVVACDPTKEAYARAADEAVVRHNNAVLIETWLTHGVQWADFIKKTSPDICLVVAAVPSGQA